jgi:hypothetical protein
MNDTKTNDDGVEPYLGTMMELDRRRALRRAGFASGLAAMAASGLLGSSTPAKASNPTGDNPAGGGPPDADIFNFALNLEYLEASFYLYAATGAGLPSSLTTGTGTQGTVSPGALVPFVSPAIQQYSQRIAVDELAHVTFIRDVLGSSSIAIPTIDVGIGPNNAFSTLAVAAGLLTSGQTFNPYSGDVAFLLGASIFEDVGVTAYAGAARYIGNPDYLEAAAGILAVEAYHSGAIRTLLGDIGAGQAFGLISALRGTLSAAIGGPGTEAEQPILIPGNDYNFVANDVNSLAFRRTTSQVLNIVYGGGTGAGLFFPAGLNGNIK